MSFKPTLCLDFDGVVHSYNQPWINAATIPDPPVPGAFDFIREAQKGGFKVAIHSSRTHQEGGKTAMQEWMLLHARKEYRTLADAVAFVASIEFPDHKPAAFAYLDDRAITFDGSWPDVQALKRFKPWNKSA